MPSLLLAALLTLSALASSAVAQEPDRPPGAQLTSRGRIMASARAVGIWSNDSANYLGGNNTWTVRADPAITYFVRDHLGVGVAASVGWTRAHLFPRGDYRTRDFALGFEFVWSAPLTARFRLLVRPFLGYGRQHGESRGLEVNTDFGGVVRGGVENVMNYVRLSASLPFVYALTNGVGVGLGPDFLFDYLFSRQSKANLSGGFAGVVNPRLPNTTRLQLGFSLGVYASF